MSENEELNFVEQAKKMVIVFLVAGVVGLLVLLFRNEFSIAKDVIDFSFNESTISLVRVFLTVYEFFWLFVISFGFYKLAKKVADVATSEEMHNVEAFESKFMKGMIVLLLFVALMTILGPTAFGNPLPQFTTNYEGEDVYVTAWQFNFGFTADADQALNRSYLATQKTFTFTTDVEYMLQLQTLDTTHGFGIYSPDGVFLKQAQIVPGYKTPFRFVFNEPGVYEIRCLEYCGLGHHGMIQKITVVEA